MGEPVAPVDPEDLPFVSDGTKTAFGLTRKPRTDPDPLRQARGKRNRRNGNAAALEWSRLTGGENVGLLTREDVRQDFMLWEVKAGAKPSLAKLEAALDQVEPHAVRRNLAHGVAWRLPDRLLGRRWLVVLRGPEWFELIDRLLQSERLLAASARVPSPAPAAPRGVAKRAPLPVARRGAASP